MPVRKPKRHFSGSAIVPQCLHRNSGPIKMHYTKGKKYYAGQYAALKRKALKTGATKQRIATVMAFVRNYFIKHGEVPTLRQLGGVFPFLKEGGK